MPATSDIDKTVSAATGLPLQHWLEQPWWPKSARIQADSSLYEGTSREGMLTVFIKDYPVLILTRVSDVIAAAFAGWEVENRGPYITLLSNSPSFTDQETAAQMLTVLGLATTYTQHNKLDNHERTRTR